MPYTNDLTAPSLHIALYQVFKSIASLGRHLPDGLLNPIFLGLRFFCLAVLGFAAWVRSFSDSSVGLWLVIGFVFCTLLHLYFGRQCFHPEDKCQYESVKDEVAKHWLKNEMIVGKDIHDKLEEILVAQENKARLEKEAYNIINYWKNEVGRSEERADDLQQQIDDIMKDKVSLEGQLEEKSEENQSIKSTFQKNITKLSNSVKSMQSVEKAKTSLEDLVSVEKLQSLEHENTTLKAEVENLRLQRKALEEQHWEAMQQIRELFDLKRELENKLLTRNALENLEKEKLREVNKLTDILRSSLMHAKGRLTKTKNTLESEHDRSHTSAPHRRTRMLKH